MRLASVSPDATAPVRHQHAQGKPYRAWVRAAARIRHLSPRTVTAYVGWIRRFILIHGKRHPDLMGESEVSAFLSSLATVRGVSASTQNQAA